MRSPLPWALFGRQRGNAAKRRHEDLLPPSKSGARLLREPLRQRTGRRRSPPQPGETRTHADAFRRNLFPKAFAVRRERTRFAAAA